MTAERVSHMVATVGGFCNKRAVIFIAAIGFAVQVVAGDFFIHDGDRVVFLGDSITGQQLYTKFIEVYALTRHPQWQLTFRNAGWEGDTSWLRQRYQTDGTNLFAADDQIQQKMVDMAVEYGLGRDVLPLKPTVVTVAFGMNDHGYQAFRPDRYRAYVRSETEIVNVLKDHGVRVALLTPQPVEFLHPTPDKESHNQSLRKFADGVKEVAAETGSLFADQFDPYMTILLREQAANPDKLIGGGTDVKGIHPGPAGHTIMAWAILKALGATALVSRAEIDGAAKAVIEEQDCQINNLKVADGVISFDRLDDALPMPIDPAASPALNLAPIVEDLNRYELRIAGLASATYKLNIDGETVATTTAEELGIGLNLAMEAGPITRQGQELMNEVTQKNLLYFNRWRNIQLHSKHSPKLENLNASEAQNQRLEKLAQLDQQIAAAESQINQLRQPHSHHFELKAMMP